MQAQMLAPAAALVLWSLVMLLWMAFTRFAAFGKADIDLSKSKPGGRGNSLDGVLPDPVMWKAHNYNHLMEQPTIFYATVVIIALMCGWPGPMSRSGWSIRCGRRWSTAFPCG